MISGSVATQFLSVISDSGAVYVHSGFQRHLENLFPVMICGFAATQFLLMIFDSAVLYAR
jgi:hypothetical protein